MLQRDTTQLFNKFAPTIDSVAARLKVPAEFVWRILVKQAYVDFATNLVVVGLLFWLVRYFAYPGFEHMVLSDKQDIEAWDVWRIVVGIIAIIPLFFYVIFLIGSIGGVINPDYYALNTILDLAKPRR